MNLQGPVSQFDCSQLVRRVGFQNVTNATRGLGLWEKSTLPSVSKKLLAIKTQSGCQNRSADVPARTLDLVIDIFHSYSNPSPRISSSSLFPIFD